MVVFAGKKAGYRSAAASTPLRKIFRPSPSAGTVPERARRRHGCLSIHHAQLDYYLDHWLIVAFPIARVTLLCDREVAATAAPEQPSPEG